MFEFYLTPRLHKISQAMAPIRIQMEAYLF